MRKLVAAVVVAALAAGCGAASSAPAGSGARAKQPGLVTSARPSPCVTNAGYGGLGGISRRFDANNNGSTGPAEPTPGAAWYQVLATARGCVIAYSVQDSAAPPLGT